MMSLSNGVIKMKTEEDKRLLDIVKHPKVRPTRIEIPIEPERIGLEARIFDLSVLREVLQAMVLGGEATLRKEMGDFVNLFWPNLAHWSGMLWDPKRFPTMTHEIIPAQELQQGKRHEKNVEKCGKTVGKRAHWHRGIPRRRL